MVKGAMDSGPHRDYMSAGSEHIFVSLSIPYGHGKKKQIQEKKVEEKGSKMEKADKVRLMEGMRRD